MKSLHDYKLDKDELKPKQIRKSGYCSMCRKNRSFDVHKIDIPPLGIILNYHCAKCFCFVASDVIAR